MLAAQIAISVASGHTLCDYYRVVSPGPVLIVEQDDPAGLSSIREILLHSRVPVKGIPLHVTPKLSMTLGSELYDWLEAQIEGFALKLVILDSYTSLRASRGAGSDFVKSEQSDMTALDELAERRQCTLLVIHHVSKNSSAKDWTEQAAGSFAMSAAVEGQIHIQRFADLDSNAPERLVRIRGRHLEGTEAVLRFLRESMSYEHILQNGAAPFYPLLLQIQMAFENNAFSPKELYEETGVSRQTATRQIERLYRAGVLSKKGAGQYVLSM